MKKHWQHHGLSRQRCVRAWQRATQCAGSIGHGQVRAFSLLACVFVCFGGLGRSERALAQPPAAAAPRPTWTENDVLQRARQGDASLRLAEAEAKAARELASAAGPYPNPRLGVEHEAIPSGYRQTKIVATIPIDFFGTRDLERAVAETDAEAAQTAAAQARSEASGWALGRFYAIVADAERLRLAQRSLDATQEAVRIVQRRQRAGASSGYEQARLTVELELQRTRVERARASLASSERDLALALEPGLKERPLVQGDLRTGEPGALERALDTARRNHPVLRAAEVAVKRAEQALDRASGFFLPRIEAMGGLSVLSENGTRVGYLLGGSLEIPLGFDRSALRARARGQLEIARARLAWLERDLDRRVRLAHDRLTTARAEQTRFEAATKEADETVLRSAQLAFREGALDLAQLLDAQRAHGEVALQRNELALEAKQAEVDLRRAVGAL